MRLILYTVGVLSLLVVVAILTGPGLRSAIYLYDEVRPFVTRYASPFCMSRLVKRNVQFTKVPEQRNGQCRILNAVKVRKVNGTNLKTPVIMTCGLALSFSEWIADINQLSQSQIGRPIDTIHHGGTYYCRKQRGSRVMSEHGYANGIDIKGFFIGGGLYNVKEHWGQSSRPNLLRGMFGFACSKFGLALGPDNDRNHIDHFHFDNGNYLGLSRIHCLFL